MNEVKGLLGNIEYVPPQNWPGEAWEILLDKFFGGEISEQDQVQPGYVLLRVPDKAMEIINKARDDYYAKGEENLANRAHP